MPTYAGGTECQYWHDSRAEIVRQGPVKRWARAAQVTDCTCEYCFVLLVGWHQQQDGLGGGWSKDWLQNICPNAEYPSPTV